jgi:N utilization substance protein B
MGTRRQSRESALQMLYQMEISGMPADAVIRLYWREGSAPAEVVRFANEIVKGVAAGQAKLDEVISAHSTNWKVSRMAAVDKNILRMAVFELESCPEIPVKVTINEAVEIAKKFGTAESGAFVNGILDNVAKGVEKDAQGGEGSDA